MAMIRRDYILKMIEECIQALRRIQSLKRGQRWQEAQDWWMTNSKSSSGTGAEGLARLTDTELLAKLLEGEPTQAVRDKTLLLVTVLQEAGDLEFMQDRTERGRAFYLKGLHLLLEVLAQEDVFEWPEFVPKVEAFMAGLQDCILPMRTQAMLMRHYERTGQFAKAEDALFAMVEEDPANRKLLEFGISFYERLRRSEQCRAQCGQPSTAGGRGRACRTAS